MRRRDFIGALSGAAGAWSLSARAEQTMPVAGFLTIRTPSQAEHLVAAVREGLKEVGYVEGRNVAIEYRYAEGRYDLLPALAAGLVDRQVDVIVAGGNSAPAIAATRTIPIVFTTGFDPVSTGLVSSLNKPDANVTGVTFYSGALGAKQMELLSELVPKTATFGLFVTTKSTFSDSEVRDTQSAARAMGRDLRVFSVNTERDIDVAFADLAALPNPALIVSVDPFFDSHPDQLIELAARHALPTVYYLRDFTQAGGLVSYGASITDTYRQAGIYAGRILKGAKPSELPIQLPTRFELVINLRTAKTLDLAVPPTLLARADAVIE